MNNTFTFKYKRGKMDSSERKICRYPLVAQKKHICGIQCPQNGCRTLCMVT